MLRPSLDSLRGIVPVVSVYRLRSLLRKRSIG
ncbi:hypothetical protein NSND_50406 [Nitrospira sp. ND1]|nr:hypothetical protein NSND_50406 [Nitrospira sp. ND1]